ncbi:MAG TPA: cytochrome c peroxidase [Flavobacterium sp.]|nr:cytochrome c peroxidase [Flavobacterium sp.]
MTKKIFFNSTISVIGFAGMMIGLFISSSFKSEEYTYNIFTDINHSFSNLDKASEDFRKRKIGVDSLQTILTDARKSYKKGEFLLAFYFPEYVSEHLNGAPILATEIENSKPLLNTPAGLQILDELIFSSEAENKSNEIANLSRRLKNSFSVLNTRTNLLHISSDDAIIAMRLQLVRLFALGVTGFDTPGSLNGIEETIASLEGMQKYLNEEKIIKNKKSKQEIEDLFDKTIAYLVANSDFDTLDRLTLLTDYIDPLYKKLGDFHKKQPNEYLANITAWNPASTSIFASDFLNPYFYTELTAEENSEQLKKLGEKLFFDANISQTKTLSCASCHQPDKAFTDGKPKSMSKIHGKTVLRNSPTLLNAVYADRYFYDLRAFSLEQQIEHVIFEEGEFNTSYTQIVDAINKDESYSSLIEDAFGNNEISRKKISKAFSSYVLSLQSFNSSFDLYARKEKTTIPDDVRNGFNLFMGKANCATCHFVPTFSGLVPPLYTDSESEILGVLKQPNASVADEDAGRYNNQISVEHLWIYNKSFKTTTVRNIALTAPYFHNGAYQTLREVVDFYDTGGGEGIGLHVENQTLSADFLNLTEKEKKDLIAFMEALSDNPFNTNIN